MKLTTKGEYALKAILDLVKNSQGTPVRLQAISERQQISLHYLEQLFRKLRQGEVVKSVRGPGGGYVLAQLPENITVGQVLTSVEKSLNYTAKLTNSGTEEHHKVVKFVSGLEETTVRVLSKSLAEINNA